MPSRPISAAPTDGTEILIRNKHGWFYVAAWAGIGAELGAREVGHGDDFECNPGWYRRADNEWDLYDSFMPQEVNSPVEWWPLPPD